MFMTEVNVQLAFVECSITLYTASGEEMMDVLWHLQSLVKKLPKMPVNKDHTNEKEATTPNLSPEYVPLMLHLLLFRECTDLSTGSEPLPIYVDRRSVQSSERSVTDLAVICHTIQYNIMQ